MKKKCSCTNTYVAIRHEYSGECLIKCRDCGRYVEDDYERLAHRGFYSENL